MRSWFCWGWQCLQTLGEQSYLHLIPVLFVVQLRERCIWDLWQSSHTLCASAGFIDKAPHRWVWSSSWFIFITYNSSSFSGVTEMNQPALCHVLGIIQGAPSVLTGVCLFPRTDFTHPGECWARAWWERVCTYTERRKYFWFLAQELKLGKSLGTSPEEWFLYDKNGSGWQRARNWSHYPEGRETKIERWKVFISLLTWN